VRKIGKLANTLKKLEIPLMTALLLTGLGIWGYCRFGSLDIALAYLRGARLIISPAMVSLGEVQRGEEREVSFSVVNYTSKDVFLLGGEASCGCVTLSSLPLAIPAQGSQELTIKVRVISSTERFHQFIRYYTDYEETPVLVVSIKGHIIN
jgi:hypothetical protein